jgi:hypothetical protein
MITRSALIDQVAGQVMGRLRTPRGDIFGEIGIHFALGFEIGDANFQYFFDSLAEQIAVQLRDAEHVDNHAHRNFLGVAENERRAHFQIPDSLGRNHWPWRFIVQAATVVSGAGLYCRGESARRVYTSATKTGQQRPLRDCV